MSVVRGVPWISVPASLREVVHDIEHASPGTWEDVSVSWNGVDEHRSSKHAVWRVSNEGHAPQVTSLAPSTLPVQGPHPLRVDMEESPPMLVHLADQMGTLPAAWGRGPNVMALSACVGGVQRYAVGGADGVLYTGTWSHEPFGGEYVTCEGHASDVTSVRFFPSAQVVLSTSVDMRARIVSALDGTCPRVLEGHTRAVNDSAIFGRGREVATGSSDGTVRVWDVGHHVTQSRWDVQDGVNALAVLGAAASTPDAQQGLLVAGTDGGRLCGWDTRSVPQAAWSARVPAHPWCKDLAHICALDADDTRILLGTSNGMSALYDVRQPSTPLDAWHRNTASVMSVELAGDAAKVSTSDGLPYSWHASTGQVHEYAGWDADVTSSICTDAWGRTIVLGARGMWATYGYHGYQGHDPC